MNDKSETPDTPDTSNKPTSKQNTPEAGVVNDSRNQGSPKPKRKRSKLPKIILIIVLALAGLVLFTPTLLSTGAGTNFIAGKASDSIVGTVEIDGLSLGWFSGQSVTGLRILDTAGNTVTSIKSIDVPDVSILGLATGTKDFGTITITGVEADVKQTADGEINLLQAVASANPSTDDDEDDSSDSEQGPDLDPAMRVKLIVKDSNIKVSSPDIDTVEVNNLTTDVALNGPSQIITSITADVVQKAHRGSISINATVNDLYSSAGMQQIDKATIDSTVELKDVPNALVDALAKQEGKLVALLGDRTNVDISLKGPMLAGDADVKVKSENLEVTAQIKKQGDAATIQPGSTVRLTVTPQAWTALRPGEAKLQRPFDLQLDIDQLYVPFEGQTPKIDEVKLQLAAVIGEVSIDTNDPTIGRVALQGTKFDLATESLGKLVTLGFSATALQNGQSGSARLNAKLSNLLNGEWFGNYEPTGIILDGRISELTLAIIDQIGGTDGLIVATLGPKLNGEFNADFTLPVKDAQPTGTFGLTAKSTNLDTNVNGNLKANGLTFADNSTVKLTVQPALVEKLLSKPAEGDQPAQPAAAKLLQPVTTTLTFRQFSLPMQGSSPNVASAAINMQLTASDINFSAGEDLGTLAVRGTNLSVTSAKLSESIVAVFNANAEQGGSSGQIALNATVKNALTADGKANMSGLTSDTTLKITQWPTAVLDQFVSAGPVLTPVLGPIVNATVTADIKPGSSGSISGPVTVSANTKNFTANINGKIADEKFTADSDSKVNLTLTPQSIAGAFAAMKQEPSFALSKPAKITVNLTELSAPLSGDTAAARFALNTTIDQFAVAAKDDIPEAALENLKLNLKPTTLAGPIEVDLTGIARQGSTTGNLKADATITDPQGDSRTIEANATVTDVPTAAVDAIAMQGGKLTSLLGPSIKSLNVNANMKADQSATFTLGAQSDNLVADLGGAYVPNSHVSLKEKSSVKLQFTPAAYDSMFGPKTLEDGTTQPGSQLKLVKTVPITLAFNSAYIPMAEQGQNTKPITLDVSLKSPAMQLQQPDGKTVSVNASDFTINTPDGKAVTVKGKTAVALSGGAPGTVDIDVNLQDLFDASGNLQLETAPVSATVTIKDLPVDPVDMHLGLKDSLGFAGPVSDVVGKTINIDLNLTDNVSTPGHMTAKIKSTNVDANFAAAVPGGIARTEEPAGLAKPMVMTLREDTVTTIQFTEALAKEVLAKINPIFINAVAADEPIVLSVKQQDFAVPLREFDISKVYADSQLKMGKLTATSGGLVRVLMKLLRQSETQTVTIAVTPFNVHLEEGVVSYSRYVVDGVPRLYDMVAALNGIELGFQGNVNLVTRKLDLETALYSHAIVTAYPDAVKYIDKDDAIVLPLTGTIDDPKIDQGKLAAEVLRIGARAGLGEKAGKWGGLINAGEKLLSGDKRKQDTSVSSLKSRRAPDAPPYEYEPPKQEQTESTEQSQSDSSSDSSGNTSEGASSESNQSSSVDEQKQQQQEEEKKPKTKEEKRKEQIEQGIKAIEGLFGK